MAIDYNYKIYANKNKFGYIKNLLYLCYRYVKFKKMIHELKTLNEYFEEVFMGHKTFEVRKNDRDFKEGDTLILREWDNIIEAFTGRELARTVTYVFEGGSFGLEKGFVVMAIQ